VRQSATRRVRAAGFSPKGELMRPIETAPKDGTVITVPLIGTVRVYWDHELTTWVLCHPLHIESIREPKGWLRADGEALEE
jgi:hypothetical protein